MLCSLLVLLQVSWAPVEVHTGLTAHGWDGPDTSFSTGSVCILNGWMEEEMGVAMEAAPGLHPRD